MCVCGFFCFVFFGGVGGRWYSLLSFPPYCHPRAGKRTLKTSALLLTAQPNRQNKHWQFTNMLKLYFFFMFTPTLCMILYGLGTQVEICNKITVFVLSSRLYI